ncbi:MAG: hypothetical protein H7259_03240 [Cytophagales bacterium]|nr:hypothetical protein [Cytophaga sp.]
MKFNTSTYIALILLQLFAFTGYAQQDAWRLFGQHNGSDVRLIWTRDVYPAEVNGILVKRRTAGAEWQTLSKTPVYPAMLPSKDLTNVSNNAAHIAAIKKRLNDNKTEYTVDSIQMRSILSAKDGLTGFMFVISKDYDLTLAVGLGYEDMGIAATKGSKVEYGIFPVIQGKTAATPVAVWSCTMGQASAAELKASSVVKAKKAKKQVNVTWSLNSRSIIQSGIVYAFHIYRTGADGKRIRLTSTPVTANVADPVCKVPLVDTLSNMSAKVLYELSPVTIFGWELIPLSAMYDPMQFPDAFEPIFTSTYKEGEKPIRFALQLPVNVIPFVDSVVLQESDGGSGYMRKRIYSGSAKELVIAFDTARAFPSKYTFRALVYLRTQEEPVPSKETDVLYAPDMRNEVVSGITGEYIAEGEKRVIRIKWNPVPAASGYYLFIKDTETGNFIWEANYGMIKATQFDYPVVINASKDYTFSVAAVNDKGGNAGALKNVATVITPSQYLLRVWFGQTVTMQDSLVKITWTYTEAADVKGYRLYENGQIITDEEVLKKGKTFWISTPRKPGNYVYYIEAVSLTGVVSPRSEERTVIIKK